MARSGDVLEIPMTGRVVFRQTAQETGGELLQFDFFLPVGQESAREHLHPAQDERFEVIRGRVRGRIDGEELVKEAGEVAMMPKGALHFWWNDSDEEAHLRVDCRPALRTEDFYKTMAALAVGERGIPNPFHGAVVMREYKDEFCPGAFRSKPRRALIILLAAIGRLLGYKAGPPSEVESAGGGDGSQAAGGR